VIARDVPPEVGALNQWRREVFNRTRRITDMDELTLAAIHEANALDELRLGLDRAARESRLKAAAILLAAVESAA
jgi:hypothetical protein